MTTLSASLYGAGVQKEALPPLFDLLSAGQVEKCEELIGTQGEGGLQVCVKFIYYQDREVHRSRMHLYSFLSVRNDILRL